MNAWYEPSVYCPLQASMASLHPASQLLLKLWLLWGIFVFVMGALLYLIFVIMICHSLYKCGGADIIKRGILYLIELSCILHVKSWN